MNAASDTRRVAVVGAGAAGLTAALRAAEAGANVTLLNAHPRIGLKILMSGGTRCNVTHRVVRDRDFNGGSRPFVARILRAFTPVQTLDWMASLGVELKLEETGKYFPASDDAQTVLDALLNAVANVGVEVVSGARVVRLERAGEVWRVGIQPVSDSAALGAGVKARAADSWPLPSDEPTRWLEADAVVLASGGLSFPRTGSDGTGYALAAALGHTIVPTVPALTPLTADDRLCVEAQGLTLPLALKLRVGGKTAFETQGSFLFTHFGYSGPAALDLSRHWLRADDAREVTASFVPGTSAEALAEEWVRVAEREPRLRVQRFVQRYVPERLAGLLAAEAGVDASTVLSQVPREGRRALIERLTARVMPVTGTLGYEKAEVTAGGVELAEVDPSTLESRKAPGLYLCGEVLDVEGRLGGFNFQWAWSSGTVAGRAAAHA